MYKKYNVLIVCSAYRKRHLVIARYRLHEPPGFNRRFHFRKGLIR